MDMSTLFYSCQAWGTEFPASTGRLEFHHNHHHLLRLDHAGFVVSAPFSNEQPVPFAQVWSFWHQFLHEFF
jgi:hypothetical protein